MKTVQICIFAKELTLQVAYEDFCFMCKKRFGTNEPSEDDWQTEFVTGTGITSERKDLWPRASERFAEYINDLRELQSIDINSMARKLIANVEETSKEETE